MSTTTLYLEVRRTNAEPALAISIRRPTQWRAVTRAPRTSCRRHYTGDRARDTERDDARNR
eukprot:5691533-Lingulodinium_polyedra.AAC.1